MHLQKSGRRRTTAAAVLTVLMTAVGLATGTGAAGVASAPSTAAVAQPVGDAHATVETDPVLSSGDAADDPAIWVHPTSPASSIVIGNDKGGALEVYDLSGTRIQRIAEGFFGNVDVYQGFVTGTGTVDLAVVYRQGIRVYRIDPGSRQLSNITDTTSGSITTPWGGEGLCLYHSATSGSLYAFSNTRDGRVAQFELTDDDGDGRVEGKQVRGWDVGSEVEGCVADDDYGHLYISEEDVGIWKYGAEPSAPTGSGSRTLVDGLVSAGGHLLADVEGLAIVKQPGGAGYLLASAQAPFGVDNFYTVYDRQGANQFIRTFRIVDGPAVDGCSHTDGIAAMAANLGPAFPYGVFVCQDDENTAPGSSGNQNFKLVPLERVVGLSTVQVPPPPPPAPGGPISFVGQDSSDANALTHTVTVPSTVTAGDALLLFFASNTTEQVSGPSGWQLLDTVTSGTSATYVWQRVAAARDAGTAVRVDVAAYSKASLILAAYRGTADDPVAGFAVAADMDSSHTTPQVRVAAAGSWAVSYWSHKDSITTELAPPSGVVVRATGTQPGLGRVTTMLADTGTSVPDGAYGGLTVTTAINSTGATMWTIILAPS